MPRIDPIQLLNCLSVLLSPNGGIKSTDEVERLASLMLKFSKKLVSKCIYIQILKCTETELLGLFMGSGGWRLVHTWLTESIVTQNWPLVRELLELLLLSPVDIDRLKTNNCPKLIKELSKDGNHYAIRALASKLVEQWLKTVKGESVVPLHTSEISKIITDAQSEYNKDNIKNEVIDSVGDVKEIIIDKQDVSEVKLSPSHETSKIGSVDSSIETNSDLKECVTENETLPVLKITLKDGKQIISQIDDANKLEEEKPRDKHKSNKSRDKDKHNSSGSKSSSSHSSKSRSSSDKHRGSHRSSSSPRRHSSSSSGSKDKSKDKDKHSSQSSKSKNASSTKKTSEKLSGTTTSTKSSKDEKSTEKFKTKDSKKDDNKSKDVLQKEEKNENKLQPPSIHKLGKIPKLSDVKKEKPSISIEVRKPDEPKPKTVKTFHSKFRKHGLEEEVKPPPSRAAVLNKKPPVLPPTVSIPKRSSPVHSETPPEKKIKIVEPVEKPGAIKLIPAKPKPTLLLESDMFMDALNASATTKKEPKKRKRRTSGSKDGASGSSPPTTPNISTSPNAENKSVPPRFYQDTLETEDDKEKDADSTSNTKETNKIENEIDESMETSEPHTLTINGLKGVLCYHKRKGPKKTIKWKPDPELEEVQYFELDETERVNVTKNFTDMKHLERINEREAFQKARNLINDDVMEERTSWRPLIPIDVLDQPPVEYGKNSKEKEIQAARQKGTLQPLYFHKSMIPDSPFEPDIETHTYSEPTIIPLEDVTGNQDNVSDLRKMPWPEPKGNAPPPSTNINVPPIFPTNISQFPNSFPNSQFPAVSGFQGPNVVSGDWSNGIQPHLLTNGMPGPMPPNVILPGGIPPGSLPPGMIGPPDGGMMMGPDMFGNNNPMFPMVDGFNMQQNMFPPDFNIMQGPPGGPDGFPGPNSFPSGPDGFIGPGNFRGAMRGRGSGGHWRGKISGNWDGPPRGRGGHSRGGKKVCIYFQRKGSCRQGENCTFLHPGVNGPF